ncbi:MAG: hypothetical protein KAJ50_01470 [Bacteroidales bacterium]|nr:hypothetical protein [Bacteroidales bacterium]
MKTKYLIYLLLITGFILSSCREITVKTTINNDGSFTRVVTIRGDSADVIKTNLPYPIDSSWAKEFVRDTSDSTVFVCTYTRSFKNADALNTEIQNDTSWRRQIKRDLEISKRFMFFYSFITYKQVYKAANPIAEDYHEYLNKEDLLWISEVKIPQNKKDSIRYDSADARLWKYWANALVNDIMEDLKRGLSQLEDPGLNDFDLSMYLDSIAANVMKWSDGKFEVAIDALVVWSGNPEVARLHDIEPPIFQDLDDMNTFLGTLIFSEKYTLEAEMPGLITETNSTMMHGNTVSWDLAALSFYFEDYEMYVESRVVNYWAFIVSGIIVLLLLITVIVKIFR